MAEIQARGFQDALYILADPNGLFLDGAADDLAGFGGEGDLSGSEQEAVGFDGLGLGDRKSVV